MGAGIAAGPHCPCAGSLPGRRGVPRRAVSSPRRLGTGGSQRRFLRSPSATEAAFRIPRGLPVRAEALAVRRSADQELASPFPPFRHPGRSQYPGTDGILGRSLGSAWQSMSRSPGSCPGGSALTEVPLSAGQVLNPKVRCPVVRSPRARRPPEIRGRFTKPTAFASAKGQARSFRPAAASSAALPPLCLPRRSEDQ